MHWISNFQCHFCDWIIFHHFTQRSGYCKTPLFHSAISYSTIPLFLRKSIVILSLSRDIEQKYFVAIKRLGIWSFFTPGTCVLTFKNLILTLISIINPEFYGESNRPRPTSRRVFSKLKAFKILFPPIFRIGFKKL